jgi:hypothetical protein
VDNDGYVVATLHTPPAHKFLIIPVDVEWIEYENKDDFYPIMMIPDPNVFITFYYVTNFGS